MVLGVLTIGYIGFEYYSFTSQELKVMPFIGVFHSPLLLFSNFLALRGISKDEALVKSVDRLR